MTSTRHESPTREATCPESSSIQLFLVSDGDLRYDLLRIFSTFTFLRCVPDEGSFADDSEPRDVEYVNCTQLRCPGFVPDVRREAKAARDTHSSP